jgi:hypothetical protein
MKIVIKDNYDREHISDKLVAKDVNLYYGTLIVNIMNDRSPDGDDYYMLVEDDYELYVFEGY